MRIQQVSTEPPFVREHDITGELRRLGICRGDSLLVHTSLRSFGRVDGGAESVIKALLAVIGGEGTVMVPAFTFSSTESFRLDSPIPKAIGAVPRTFMCMPGSMRSLSPTHSVGVIGPKAEAYIARHMNCSPIGIGSPIDRLAKDGGWVVLLGVDHRANSAVHLGESYARMPYLKAPRRPGLPDRATVVLPTGDSIVVKHGEMPGCSAAFNRIDAPLRSAGKIAEGRVGAAVVQVMRAKDVAEVTAAELGRRPGFLLCNECERCEISRRRLREAL